MQLTIQEYSQTAAALSELRDRYANVVFPVETTKGMKDASEARKALREIRVGLEKMRKEIKAPALERCRLIDEEAKIITLSLRELEDPIDEQIKVEEARKEREKQERERIERERVAAIRKKIEGIVNLPSVSMNDTAEELDATIIGLQNFEPGEEFAEFVDEVKTAKGKVLDALTAMHARRVEQEKEAARLEAERAEFERLKAEAAERQRIEDEKRKAEQARLDAERAEVEAKLAAERAEIEAQRAELERQKKEAARAEQERLEASARERDKVIEQARQEAEAARIEAERATQEADQEKPMEVKAEVNYETTFATSYPAIDAIIDPPDRLLMVVSIIRTYFECDDDEAMLIIIESAEEIQRRNARAA